MSSQDEHEELATLIRRVGTQLHQLFPVGRWDEVAPHVERLWRANVAEPDWSLAASRLERAWEEAQRLRASA
ncbi:hypothetical protein ACHZ97_09595 [Lysobacter soli]|uniref:hypothetical protein n=1 Tax=Lysobacter soli TaxID=453783 RepID=UPI0037C89539